MGGLRGTSTIAAWTVLSLNRVMKSQKYPVGRDCVWIAGDRDGQVAAFATAGIGPIPILVLDGTGPPLLKDIEEAALVLPKISACRLVASVPRPDSFVALAERGFFVYDWSDIHRTRGSLIEAYELMAYPLNPISLDALPQGLRSCAAGIKYGANSFSRSEQMRVTDYFECVAADKPE